MADALEVATPGTQWNQDAIGVGGIGASYWASNIAATLAARPNKYFAFLVNIGVNDFATGVEATWKANMETVIDAMNAHSPNALVYITKPWKRGSNATADTFAGWVDDIVAANAFARVGDDERSWLKGVDDGAANTSDGTHYSTAGQTAAAAQKQTILGY